MDKIVLLNRDFFVRNQRVMLALLNAPVIGLIFRWLLWVDSTKPIVKITPYSYHVRTGRGKYRMTTYSNAQYAQALRKNFMWLWRLFHWWDMVIANPLRPAWNVGFDTLDVQPDGTDGVDTYIQNTNPATNAETVVTLRVGEVNSAASIYRSLIKFTDISTIPSYAEIDDATLSTWVVQDLSSNARDMKLYRVLRNWVEAQATWTIYSTGNSWTTSGCGSDGNDADLSTVWATTNFTATESVGTQKDFSVDVTEFAKWVDGTYNNYGWLMQMDTETNDAYYLDSSDSATAGERPRLVVNYTLNDAGDWW